MFMQLVTDGIAVGGLYALTAVGVVVVFRNTRTINLAQGDFAMMGAFIGLVLLKSFGLNYFVVVPLVVISIMGIGVIVERVVMRPLADSDWLILFHATLGVYFILHGLSGWLWGRDTKAFPIVFDPTPVELAGAIVSKGHLINVSWTIGIGLVLYLFFRYTKQGIALRAVTDDPEAARMMGIPVRFIVMLTWAVAGFLAAFAGLLTAPIIYVSAYMMDDVLIKGYVAAVFLADRRLPQSDAGARTRRPFEGRGPEGW